MKPLGSTFEVFQLNRSLVTSSREILIPTAKIGIELRLYLGDIY